MGERQHRHTVVMTAMAALCWLAPAAGEDALVLTTESGVQLALQHNERIMMARSERIKADEKTREARAEGLPQLDANVNYDRNWLLPSFVFNDNRFSIGNDNNLTGSLRLTQPLYRGGGIRAQVKEARLEAQYAREVERAVRQQLTAEVEAMFYQYLLAAELARVSDLAVQRARSNQARVEALRRAGQVSEYDLLRARVQVTVVSTDSLSAHTDVDKAKIRLVDRLGLDLQRTVRVEARFRTESALAGTTIDSLLDVGAKRRPEALQLAQLIRARQRQVQVEKAAGRPRVDLVVDGQMQYQEDDLDLSDPDQWQRSWSTGVRVRVPIFDGKRSGARTAQAREETVRLGYERRQLVRGIQREIIEAWMDWQESLAREEASRGTVQQATSGLGVAQSRYEAGAGTQLEILDAQLLLVQAESDLAVAQRDRALAIVELERAVGVLGE
jgi:outer membrane protein